MAPDLTSAPYTGVLVAKDDGLWVRIKGPRNEALIRLWPDDRRPATDIAEAACQEVWEAMMAEQSRR